MVRLTRWLIPQSGSSKTTDHLLTASRQLTDDSLNKPGQQLEQKVVGAPCSVAWDADYDSALSKDREGYPRGTVQDSSSMKSCDVVGWENIGKS